MLPHSFEETWEKRIQYLNIYTNVIKKDIIEGRLGKGEHLPSKKNACCQSWNTPQQSRI